jgi:hypothetical protein
MKNIYSLILIGFLATMTYAAAPANPPQNDISVLNTTAVTQSKAGDLQVGFVGSEGGLWASSTLAVGTSTDPATKGFALLVDGRIGWENWCAKIL